jgi:hypothetical protein
MRRASLIAKVAAQPKVYVDGLDFHSLPDPSVAVV